MKIRYLLEQNKKNHHARELSQNFGDAYLLQHNQIYRNIRQAVVKIGYIFSSELNSAYLAFPFSQLESILNSKVIPYTDNVGVLIKLIEQLKDDVTWDDISDGFKRNYIFHESCHGVIRNKIEEILKPGANKCLQMLLEESFANTCELLAVMDADDQAHKIFFETNSYTFLFESRSFFKNAIKECGQNFVFKFFILAYLHSNFLFENLDNKQFERVIQLALDGSATKLDSGIIKNLKALAKIPFTLDLRFRTVTTSLHLRMSGLKKSPQELLDFDFLSIFSKQPEYLQLLNLLAEIIFEEQT